MSATSSILGLSGRVVLVFALLATSAPADPSTRVAGPDDVVQIKRLAVVSALGDTLRGAKTGVTRFENKFFDATIAGWTLDADIAKYMQERITASGKVKDNVEILVVPKSDKKVILDRAREQGFDAVIGALPERDPSNEYVYFKPTILVSPFLSGAHACAGMAVRVWRVSDGKELGFSQPRQCNVLPIAGVVWHDSWSDFTDEEKHKALESIESFVQTEVVTALAELKFRREN